MDVSATVQSVRDTGGATSARFVLPVFTVQSVTLSVPVVLVRLVPTTEAVAVGKQAPGCAAATGTGLDSTAVHAGLGTTARIANSCARVAERQVGNGTCICNTGFIHDSNGQCNFCAPGRYGDSCYGCDTDAYGNICSSRGVCIPDPSSGSGVCSCMPPWGGSICQYQCPTLLNKTCGGGICSSTNVCYCLGNLVLSGGVCSLCVEGYFGNGCVSTCPVCVNGVCNGGLTGDGSCLCNSGYFGTLCQSVCPGGASNPCSGHGACDALTGVCTCFSSPSAGFYVGSNCSVCLASYNSYNCMIPCPMVSGTICAGRGTCFNGTCSSCVGRADDTYQLYCGRDCNTSGSNCLVYRNVCPTNRYGSSCTSYCPAANDTFPDNTCNRQGFCNPDTGVC